MRKRGFTLIELLAVIVVLAIIALIATPMVLNTIEEARQGAAEVSALNYVKEVERYMVMSNIDSTKYPVKLKAGNTYQVSEDIYQVETGISLFSYNRNKEATIYLNDYIEVKGDKPTKGIVTIGADNTVYSADFVLNNYSVVCDTDECEVNGVYSEDNSSKGPEVTCENNVCESESLLAIMSEETLTTGYYTFKVNGDNEVIEYPVHLIVYDGDQEWTESQTFGDENDVSDGTNYAQNMVIVKVNGNLTIAEGVTIAPYSNTYGGPKGFTLYVTGKLTNNGTIDNSHGAYAEGENVYLLKNADNTYEYVPAIGAAGGDSRSTTGIGYAGEIGTNRQTGGGGSGGVAGAGTSGAGGTGTSYSGGSGGGGARGGDAGSASNVGGAGGNGTGTSGCYYSCSGNGGAGNPGGFAQLNGNDITSTSDSRVGKNGTGGLLVIYASTFENNDTISANGSVGGVKKTNTSSTAAGGGSSGGGSINLFYNELVNIGTVTADGGAASNSDVKGGVGGTGTVTYLQI